MKLHILNLHLSRLGGGIFTVIKELYNSKAFKNSIYSQIHFWGYIDAFVNEDITKLPGCQSLFRIPFKKWNKFFYSGLLKNAFRKDISENDIIHLHSIWLFLSLLAIKGQKKYKAKKIISVHGMLDSWALQNGKLKKKIILSLFERKNLQTADCIHALCEQEYKDIRKIASRVPIAVIPNGINLPQPSLLNSVPSNSKKTLLFLSRIHPKKGLENLLISWATIKNVHWDLIIVGPDENNYLRELELLSKNLKIEDTVKFAGPKFGKDKQELLMNVNAFILPSFSEGLPMSVLEAWSYKLPVLMTPQCNLSDGFESNSAIKIEPTKESIADGLIKLFSMDESSLAEMGNNGFNLVKEKYTWDSVACQIIELYDWVLGKTEKPYFVRLD